MSALNDLAVEQFEAEYDVARVRTHLATGGPTVLEAYLIAGHLAERITRTTARTPGEQATAGHVLIVTASKVAILHPAQDGETHDWLAATNDVIAFAGLHLIDAARAADAAREATS